MELTEWIPRSRKGRYLAGAALLVIGVAYAGGHYLHQSRGDVTSLEARLGSLRAQNAVARSLVGSGAPGMAEDSLARYREGLVAVERLVPPSEELPELLDAIATEARASAVDLNYLQPIDVVPEGDYVRRVYAVGILGRYHDIGRFLTSIASLPRILTPADLALVPSGEVDAAGTPVLHARLVIETYVTSNPTSNALPNP